ncbi:hypothetical protein ASG07_02130 [Sphingomonas sp. Leaf343]|nr:hypothetical protein ASG07_02130 [Sphingomonas sp. Leaf343]
MMRPKSVVQAERIYLAATGLLLASSVAVWPELTAAYGFGLAAGVTAFTVGAFLLLILLTTRRGSGISRILLTILTAFGVASLLYQIATAQLAFGLLGVINTVQVVLTVIGAVLLFRPNAGIWFAREHDEWEEDA